MLDDSPPVKTVKSIKVDASTPRFGVFFKSFGNVRVLIPPSFREFLFRVGAVRGGFNGTDDDFLFGFLPFPFLLFLFFAFFDGTTSSISSNGGSYEPSF